VSCVVVCDVDVLCMPFCVCCFRAGTSPEGRGIRNRACTATSSQRRVVAVFGPSRSKGPNQVLHIIYDLGFRYRITLVMLIADGRCLEHSSNAVSLPFLLRLLK